MLLAARRLLACVGVGLVALGCAVGPGYVRPDAPVPAAWTPQPSAGSPAAWKEASPRDRESRGQWWTVFGDPALDALQTRALASSQTLQAAAARVLRARAIARISAAEWSPAIGGSASYEHARRSLNSFGGAGSIDVDTFSTPIDLSYEVDLWGRVRRSFEAARAESQASEAAFQTALLTLTADVATNYVLLRELDTERRILEEAVALRRRAMALVEQRVAAGVTSALDAERVRTELASAEAELLETTRRRSEFEHALALLCGAPAPEFAIPRGELAGLPPSIPPGLPSQLLERRPDIAQAERQMAAANARIGVAQAAFFPVLRLTGSGGLVSIELDDLFSADSRVWSLGPSVSVPLLAGGRNVAGVRAARAQYDEAVADYRQRVLTALREVEDALSGVRLRAEQAEAQARAVRAARQSAKLSTDRYAQGLVSLLEVVDAERSRLAAERAAAQILSQRLIATVLLVKALGGGWELPPASP